MRRVAQQISAVAAVVPDRHPSRHDGRDDRRYRGFSLLEVVVAVGIFAIGMVGVVSLFSPVAKSVTFTSDAEAAARVADALRTKLQTLPFTEVVQLLKTTSGSSHELAQDDARSDYNPAADAKIVFASRDGAKVGVYNDPVWNDPATGRNTDGEKFFEIALIRNEAISPLAPPPGTSTPAEGEGDTAPPATPADPDATAVMLAYTARVRWPAFVKDSPTTAVQVGSNTSNLVRFDHSLKQVMFFTGSITR